MMLDLAVIIPVFNEQRTIVKIVKSVIDINPKEIIIIDDGSTDKTRLFLSQYKKNPRIRIIRFNKNFGKGTAIKFGLKSVKSDFVVIQDADLEYNPKDIAKMYQYLTKNRLEVVYGNRFHSKNRVEFSSFYIGNRLIIILTNLLFHSQLSDVMTCYKMIKRDIFNNLSLKSNGFEIEAEITAKLLGNGVTISQIPISYKPRNRIEGKKINWTDGVKVVNYLIRFKLNSLVLKT